MQPINEERHAGFGENSAIPFWTVPLVLAVVVGVALLTRQLFFKSSSGEIETRTWTAMGTVVSLSLCEVERSREEALFGQVEQQVNYLEEILSSHIQTSELSRLNGLPVGEKMRLSRELWDAVNAGIIWNGKTHGAFDITAAPLIHLWEKAGEMQRVPTAAELELARSEMGVSKFVLHENGWTILKTAGVTIDLGGLGKGFTSDDIASLLQRQGVVSALVAMSGDIRAMGQRPDGRPWRVGIQDPRYPDDLSAIVTAIHLSDMAVSTSGNYRRFVEIDGKHCSHIVDPRSGWTVENVPSVSVIGPDALTTDILGTALSVLGVAEGLKLVESLEGVESLFMVVNDSGELILTRSSGFAEYEDVTGHKGREM